MSSSTSNTKASRWGSFLQSAVTGLESRLDTILAEDDQASAKGRAAEEAARQAKATLAPAKADNDSRASSRSRPSSRLQDRLAKAMVKGAEAPRSASKPPSELPSRTISPAREGDAVRTSMDSKLSDGISETAQPQDGRVGDQAPQEDNTEKEAAETTSKAPEVPTVSVDPTPTLEVLESVSSRPSLDSAPSRPSLDTPSEAAPTLDTDTSSTPHSSAPLSEAELIRMRQEHEAEMKQRQEELHAHMERIDALQAKLQYLAKAAAETARQAAVDSAAGSTERKLAEKDEQIALLMEEGQKLSKTEMKQLNTIKALRARLTEGDKTVADIRKRLAKADKAAADAVDRAKRAEAEEKQAGERTKQLARIEKDVEALQSEREAARVTIADLRRQLEDATTRAEEAEGRAQTEALEAERKIVAELRDELAKLESEKKQAEDRAKAEIKEIKDRTTRQQEQASVMEMELRGEIANLETKLEVLRARTEQVSSSAAGDSQAKLLRQIETLQTQYALASENWQGIEGTLNSRVAALEKERDEVSKREADIRRKAREVNAKSRRLEEELESVQDKARTFEQDVQEQRAQLQKLQSRLTQSETALADARVEFEQEKKIWETQTEQRIEEEKLKWQQEILTPTAPDPQFLRAESPTASFSTRKHSQTDLLNLHSRRNINRTMSTELSPLGLGFDRTSSRRPSTQPLRTPDTGTPHRQMSLASLAQLNGTSTATTSISQTPSLHTIDADPDTAATQTSSPHQTLADLLSTSTAQAGPSIQLVSSMSAAVRRLEAEKAASKEELARLAAQRDEARGEVVALMREVEEKRRLERDVERLRRELGEVDQRYQTTLEMLGERSEEVEELRNDVVDLKKIYRELVDSVHR